MPEPNVKPFDESDFKSEKCKFDDNEWEPL